MPLPVKIHFTPAVGECERCHQVRGGIRISLLTRDSGAETGPICFTCLRDEVGANLLLTEFVPPDGRHKKLRRQQRISQKQEVEIAEELEAFTQKASGAIEGHKGDGRKKGVLRFEAKFTEAKSFALKLEELYKIASECHGTERPLLVIDFRERGTGKLNGRYAVVDFEHAKEMFHVGHDR